MSKIDKFDRKYFLSLKTQKERELYFMKYITKGLDKMEKGGSKNGN